MSNDQPNHATPRPPRDAVTAVLQWQDEILYTIRQPALAAFPGYCAFPGGKVDPHETPPSSDILAVDDPQLMGALCREVLEETGFDLDAAAKRGEILRVHALGSAITPAFAKLRFDTRFYNIELRSKPELHLDPGEIASGGFASAAALLERWEAGDLLAVPPTVRVIKALAKDPDAESVVGLNPQFDEAVDIPLVEPMRGVQILLVRSNTLPPADRTNCFVIGDHGHAKLMIDPSPANADEYHRLLRAAKSLAVDRIFLTHHHPDHRQFAGQLARELGLPIQCSEDSRQRIAEKSAGFFEGIDVMRAGDGDVVTQWLGHSVNLHAIPGHDEGQLGLAPDNLAWFIVGDLIQGVGTVVIASPEGNMRKYFATLERVIELDPAVIYPSHGMGMGSTFRLKATLAHRLQREKQVLDMHNDGRNEQEMLDQIYGEIDPRLLPLALCNIRSHLEKLHEEQQINAIPG